jgi:uncharacterized membrane protein
MKWLRSIPAFLELFKEGKELTDATTWKTRTVATNVVVAFFGTLVVLAKNAGIDLQLDQETLANLGAGIVALVSVFNAVMHLITDKRVGLSSNIGGGPTQGPTADVGQSPTV